VSDYVTVERADNEAMAELIRQRLEQSGIPSIIESGRMAALAGAGASYAVTVPADRVDEAKALLGE
jgi:Putative prokaryotic signal transducing protein